MKNSTYIFWFVVLAGCLANSSAYADSADPAKPNIIWILADDLGYADLSCMGQKSFATPNLDRMAGEGMKFTQFYAGCTVCAPSRACLLTGQHTGHVYQRFNGPVQFRENPRDITIASVLKRAGYRTAMIGKSGLSCNSFDGSLPNRKGFDHFFGVVSHVAAHRYYPRELWRDGKLEKIDGNFGMEGKQYSTDLFVKDALKFVSAEKGKPFFLHLSLQQPHADLQVPDQYIDKVIGVFEDPAYKGTYYRSVPKPKATFVGMMKHLDESVGKLLDQLRTEGLAENTLVIFSSDNGPHFEGGHHPDNLDSNGPLRGGKRDLYEGGIRVPMIAWWPGKVSPGTTSNHISAFWDLPATACELAGLSEPENSDGISIVPTLTGKTGQLEHDYLYWEFHGHKGKQAVRMGKWKGIRLNVKKERYGKLELYNLSADIGETNNVAAQHPDIVKQLEQAMRQAHTPSDSVSFERGVLSSHPPSKRITGGKLLDRSGWTIEASSQDQREGLLIGNAIDDQDSTFWKSNSSQPQWIRIDLGQPETITGIRILNRLDGNVMGLLCDYQVRLSLDGNFDDAAVKGSLATNLDEHRIPLKATKARYLKIEFGNDAYDRRAASLAEINLETE